MMNTTRTLKTLAAAVLAAMATLSCSNELTNDASPVEFVVTHESEVSILDVSINDDPDCEADIGTIQMRVLPKSTNAGGNLVQVRVDRYRVSYRRTDGGTIVPASYVRAIDTLVGVGQTAGATFSLFELGAFSQAPFAGLLPQNGGRDAETLRPFIRIEVIVEVFGETLAGDNVYDSTTIPLEFCYDCGGCR
jgi:hypothetical protein